MLFVWDVAKDRSNKVGPVTLLLVVHTYVDNDGEEIIRIISARKATRHERSQYEYGP